MQRAQAKDKTPWNPFDHMEGAVPVPDMSSSTHLQRLKGELLRTEDQVLTLWLGLRADDVDPWSVSGPQGVVAAMVAMRAP